MLAFDRLLVSLKDTSQPWQYESNYGDEKWHHSLKNITLIRLREIENPFVIRFPTGDELHFRGEHTKQIQEALNFRKDREYKKKFESIMPAFT